MQTSTFAFRTLYSAMTALILLANLAHGQGYETPPPPRPLNEATDSTASSSSSTTVKPGTNGRLQVAPSSESTPPANQNTSYIIAAEPRSPLSGYSVSVFAGMNVAQQDDLSTIGGAAATADSNIAPMGGFKFGYIWPFDNEPIDQFYDETASSGGVRLSGGLEAEAFYLRNNMELSTATNVDKVELDMGFMMLNATLQAQWGKFRIYGGPGVGMAIIGSSNYGANGAPGFQDDDVQLRLALQGIGGLDYFITPEWSLFGEYKYLIVDNFELSSGATSADFGRLTQHIIAVGVRKHF